jgi:PAS domain S-box-containing protein
MLLVLIQNIALLVALAVGLQALTHQLGDRGWIYRAATGLLFGLAGLAVMMTPVRFAPGVIYDGRSIVLSLAGLFGGGVPAMVAALICGSYRLHLGGAGVWAGLSVILESALLGVALHHLRKRDSRWVSPPRLLAFGLVVHAIMLGLQLLIPKVGWEVLRSFGLPILVFYPIAFLLAAQVFLDGERRRAAVLALAQSEERYRSLFENNHAVMLIIDPDGGAIIDANPAACAFYGWTRGELRRMHIGQINTSKPDQIKHAIAEVTEGKRDFFEFRHRRADGSVHDVEVYSGAINFSGKPLIYSIIHDVSTRHAVEQALRENERRYRELVESTEAITWEYDPAHDRWTYVAPQAESMLGWRPEQWTDLAFWTGNLHPVDREATLARRLAAAQHRKRELLEYRFRSRSGDYLWLRDAVTVETEQGRPLKLRGIMMDITASRQAEDAARLMSRIFEDSLNEAYLFSTDTFRFRQANRAALRNLGYQGEELLKLTPLDIKPEMTREKFETLIAPLRDDEGKRIVFETVHARKDGSRYPVEVHLQLLRHGGEPLFAAIILDISERKQAEAERLQFETQLRQSQRLEAVGQLAGGVAHDFNNLLQVILGYGELAQHDGSSGPGLRRNLEEVLKAGRRAQSLVGQLLAFSRRQVLEMKNVDLNDAIADMLKMLRRVIGEHITLEVLAGKDLGIVRADPGQIGQILTNLCVNARDAIPEGGTITIETANVCFDEMFCQNHAWARPGHFILLRVTDTGCGMDSETIDKIFEPFFTTKEPGKGTGLGLATVYGLISQHDGFLHVDSEIGRGTTFEVYLPKGERSEAAIESTTSDAPPAGTETILLAEDDESVRKLTQTILEGAGYKVLTAADGEEALALFVRHADNIGMMLLDVIMPKLGGRELYERIRRSHPRIPVLFASGYSMDAIHTNFVLEEGLTLIQKPYLHADLLQRVRQKLDSI